MGAPLRGSWAQVAGLMHLNTYNQESLGPPSVLLIIRTYNVFGPQNLFLSKITKNLYGIHFKQKQL